MREYRTAAGDSNEAQQAADLIFKLELHAPTENLNGLLLNVYDHLKLLAQKDLITDASFAVLADRIMTKREEVSLVLRVPAYDT